MRKLSILTLAAAAVLAFASCEPQVFSMFIEMRKPSKSGLDLAGKTMSVVYMDDLSGRDTVFNAMVAQGFAQALEDDYFGGNEAVNVYRMEKDMAGNYASKDTLVNLVMQTGDDVVFLFDSPEFGKVTLGEKSKVANAEDSETMMLRASAPFKLNMYAYNTMGADTVRVFKGSSDFTQVVFCKLEDTDEDIEYSLWQGLGAVGESTGTKSSVNFVSTWEPESFSFYYFESPDAWLVGGQAAYEYKWHEAIDQWLSLLGTKSMVKRAAAEYNIASAFYLLGDYAMAEKWLDQSDTDNPMPLSAGLRKRINSQKK